jgi:putative AdoMet-dependent methyltransferase
MGREFVDLFNEWAENYDETVLGIDEQYKKVFENYHQILNTVALKSFGIVLEFGPGTGNLTEKLSETCQKIYAFEPSEEMREKAIEKRTKKAIIQDGDFLQFTIPEEPVNCIVSTYAFHHLTDAEKSKAIEMYGKMLSKDDKIIFADTVYKDDRAAKHLKKEAMEKGYYRLVTDLNTEYYTTISVLQSMFEKHNFTVEFKQLNSFVWIIEATKN